MRKYKLVYLNRKVKMSRKKDLAQAEKVINEYISDGWELQQIISPDDMMGAMVGVFYRDEA